VGRFTTLVDLPDINELRKKLGSRAAPPVLPTRKSTLEF
jgi:hypothetical protein